MHADESEPILQNTVKPTRPGTLAVRAFGVGASGDHVRDLQQRLSALAFTPGPADGEFGIRTGAAVREFQQTRRLDADGICGTDTWSALVEAGHRLGNRLLYLHSPMFRGDDVGALQEQLAALGFDPGRVDSIFGPDTRSAVVDFQSNTGLVADGIAGAETVKMFGRLTRRDHGSIPVSTVRELERLLTGPRTLAGFRVVIGERGGLDAVSAAVHRVLGELGADVVTLHHPDWETQADRANVFEADAFVGLVVRHDQERSACFFAGERSESIAGRELATALSRSLSPILGELAVRGMRLPVLRATRMPAVVCRLGAVGHLVPRTPAVARAVRSGLQSWIEHLDQPAAL
jgi:N-acetylmuramoyl-L-alanine amidase